MKKYTLNSPVSELSGVGAAREKQLSRLGIYTLRDLIYLFPRAYEKRGDIKLISEVIDDSVSAFILTVGTQVRSANLKRGLTISKFRAFDESGSVEISFFNSPYVKDVFHIGDTFRFYGKPSLSRGAVKLTNPKFDPVIEGVPLPSLVPIYPLTEGISSKFIDKITKTAFDAVINDITDPLPDNVRIENSLPVLSYALRNIHFPEDDTALGKALRRLAFEEMFAFGIGISLSARYKTHSEAVAFSPCDMKPFTSLFPYELTRSQKETVNDIYRDTVLKKENGITPQMARIVVGDVGSGKTVCALAAIYIAAKSGFQAAMMAPTEILARQHYSEAKRIFDSLGIKTELLLGSTTQKEKKRIYESLKNKETDVLIGTHALITDKVEFNSLGLVITDEQHRFGVAQRATLKDKAKKAHMLVMSATPIPRTLALTMYGDLDVSRITEMPKGRIKVDTFVVDETYRDRLCAFISKQVENGGQCYVVCPAIEDAEEEEGFSPTSLGGELLKSSLNLKNVKDYTDILKQKLPHLRIESLHGKMKAAEKDAVMQRFSSGETDILVSTTVIEVGVNVPNASLMVVENADRFGLSQLHQLRGRVGRGTRKSYCVLVSDLNTEKSKSRLEIMRTTYDGYEIAEKDLVLRGPGDFFSSESTMRQSGGFEFNLAKLCDDKDLFEKAFAEAKALVARDPELIMPENQEIKKVIEKIMTPQASTIS